MYAGGRNTVAKFPDQSQLREIGRGGTMGNAQIAERFETLADLLEIENANPYRVRAYRRAAWMIRGYPEDLCDLVDRGEKLEDLPTIGKDLAGKIAELCRSGKLPLLDQVSRRTPVALKRLMRIPGLGPKRVRVLFKTLGIRSERDLERATRAGKISRLHGFGPGIEARIKRELRRRTTSLEGRVKRADARKIAAPLIAFLKTISGVKTTIVAGSFRRCRETVGDLDIVLTATARSRVLEQAVTYPGVTEVVTLGRNKSTVILRGGMQVDMQVVPTVSLGAALHYFTGSRAHTIAIRQLAKRRGLKINEYGVYRGKKRVAGRTEAEVYRSVGLPYIEPELRRGHRELEAARSGSLPKLVSVSDIRGDLHCHSRDSDGRHTLEAMAKEARKRGYEYLAITDHSRRARIANGLDRRRLLEQLRHIDTINERLENFTILKGCEVEILRNGSLDLPDEILKRLDLTVCAVHYDLSLTRDKQTDRIIRAMDNPYFTVLAHPTGRLINERAPYPVDLEKIFAAARERHCFVELNGHPDRLDLTSESCLLAKEMGVQVAISSDAHRVTDLDFMLDGVEQARRGWLEPANVLNALSLTSLRRKINYRRK